MSKCRMWTTNLQQDMEIWFKQKIRPRMNQEWIGKTIQKKIRSRKKRKKTANIKVNLPHVNKKPLARKRIYVQTPFSHTTLKLERKKFTPQNH